MSGENAAIYATEQTVQSFLRQMDSLGMDVRDYFLLNHLQIYPVSISPDSVDPEELFEELGEHMKEQEDCSVLVVDALTTFVSQAGGDQIQDFSPDASPCVTKGRWSSVPCTLMPSMRGSSRGSDPCVTHTFVFRYRYRTPSW